MVNCGCAAAMGEENLDLSGRIVSFGAILILRTGVLEAFLFPRDTGNRTSLPARMFRPSVLELKEAHPS